MYFRITYLNHTLHFYAILSFNLFYENVFYLCYIEIVFTLIKVKLNIVMLSSNNYIVLSLHHALLSCLV